MFINRNKNQILLKITIFFLKRLKKLKPYLVDFNKDNTMKKKDYLANCTISDSDCQPVIMIIYDKYIFLSKIRLVRLRL